MVIAAPGSGFCRPFVTGERPCHLLMASKLLRLWTSLETVKSSWMLMRMPKLDWPSSRMLGISVPKPILFSSRRAEPYTMGSLNSGHREQLGGVQLAAGQAIVASLLLLSTVFT